MLDKSTAQPGETETGEPVSLVDFAYERIVAGIIAHRYAGGEVLQEARLAQTLGLSRTPVREALGRLEGEGLLVRSGRTLLVRAVTVKDYLEALQVRRLVETEAIALGYNAIPIDVLEDLRARVVALVAPRAISADEHWQLDNDIHQTIANASGNDLLAQLIADLRLKTRLFNLQKVANRFEPRREEHLRIIDALIARDREGARQAMPEHLDNVKNTILGIIGR